MMALITDNTLLQQFCIPYNRDRYYIIEDLILCKCTNLQNHQFCLDTNMVAESDSLNKINFLD